MAKKEGRKKERDREREEGGRAGGKEESSLSLLLTPPNLKTFLSFRPIFLLFLFLLWLLKGNEHRSGDSI